MEEHHNHITYWRFREGICQALELDEKASDEEKDALIKEIETKWWFCGGRDTRVDLDSDDDEGEKDSVPERVLAEWERLWRHYFPDIPMPEADHECVCSKRGLRYNVYITDGQQVIIIGRICLRQFLPRQAAKMNSKRCDRCFKPHQNRKDNYCKECRILNKKDEEDRAEEEHQEWLQAREQRMLEMTRRRAEEAKREAEEAERLARVCMCGSFKQPQFPQCFNCSMKKKKEEIAKMTPQQMKAFLCQCGAKKKPQFSTCWSCRG